MSGERERPARAGLALRAGQRRALLVVGDWLVIALLVAVSLALGARRSAWAWDGAAALAAEYGRWLVLCGGLWTVLAAANGLYDARQPSDYWGVTSRALRTGAQIVVVWALAYFVLPPWTLVRHVLVFFTAGAALAMPAWRVAYAALARRPAFRRRLLVIGAGQAGRTLIETLRAEAPHAFEVVGLIDDDPALRGAYVAGAPVVGGRATLVEQARAHDATELVLAITGDVHAELFAALMDAREQGLPVTTMPVLYEQVTGRVPVEHVGRHWQVALPLDPLGTRGVYPIARRALDLAFALAGGALLLLLLPLLAPLIRGTSRGPVFLRQTRVGRGGRPFTLYKLRTMVEDAEPDGPVWAAANDARVTSVGRWLRRSRLDELPQVLNILRGEMSLIGPRPERPAFVDELAAVIPFYRARHAVRPGLTGWATVNQGYAASTEAALRRLQYDLYAIKNPSPWLDMHVLLRTVAHVLGLRGR